MKCRVPQKPNGDACPNTATHVVEFADGQKEPVCQDCALHLSQVAESHGTRVRVERIAHGT